MRDGEERLQAGERALVDAGDQALERAEQAAVGDEQRRQQRRQRRRQHAFLDGQAVGKVLLVDDLDLARDAGADVEPLDLGRVADADGVDRQLGAVAEGDDVAVGGEARPSRSDTASPRSRERSRISVEPSVPAASTTMSAVTTLRLARAVLPLEVDAPAAVGRLGDVAHLGVREDLGAVPRRVGQIGERHRVLGADVAAPAAVAAARAGGLRDAGRIDGRLEADHHRRVHRRLAQRDGRRAAAPGTWCARPPPDRAPAAPSAPPARSPPRAARRAPISSGQTGSRNTRGSGRSATPALISEPPPRPQPTSTCMSSPRRTS